MRIAIDTRMIGSFKHGISRYAYNLIKGISDVDKKNDYVLISNDNYLNDFVSSRENFSLRLTKPRLYGIREQITIPRVLKEEKVDIFHSPSFFGPIIGECKVVMTIHDMIHVLFPEESSVFHRAYYSFIVKRAAKNACRILTVSENSKHDIAKYLNVPLKKIVVTYNAVDEIFRRSNGDRVNEIKDRFGISGRFILYVGNQKPHKNVGLLIEAYKQLRGRIDHQLVIVGQKDQSFLNGLKNNMLEGVVIVGEISDEFLPHFYSEADVFVSPSLYEGFGLPLIEAIACGTAVVAIKTPSVSEILGKAGVIVESKRPEELADAIYRVLTNESLRNNLIKEGLKRRNLFSWENTVRRTLDIYEDIFKTHYLERSKRLHPVPLVPGNVRRMRVGINISKVLDVHTGVGRFTNNLCKSISKIGSTCDYFLYTTSEIYRLSGIDHKAIHVKKAGIVTRNNTLRILWEQIVLPFYSLDDRLDLFHYTDHASSILQRRHPFIITVHDIAFIRFPHLFNKSRQIYKKYIFEKSISKADVIIVPSNSTKKDILHYCGIKSSKVKIVNYGVERRFRPIGDVEAYRLENSLPLKMILNIGTLEPRKNVISLIRAFKKLKVKGLKDYKLVIVGDKGWLYNRIFKEIESSNMRNEVLFPGIIKDDDLPMLYNCADIFVYPSLYEGFGLPILEAMACGIPVITSNTSSLPEVVGEAGIMVGPTDINSLCEAMYNVLTNNELRQHLSSKGLERSKLFSWEDTARKILEIYKETLLENRSLHINTLSKQ